MGIYSDYPRHLYKNGGGIYAAGVYKSRGIYKDVDLKDCFFLTYFDNFDELTGVDNPLVGDPYTLDVSKQTLSKASLNLFGETCPALKDEYKQAAYTGFAKIIPEGIEFISSELFILCEGTRPDFGSVIGFGVANLVLDPYYSSDYFGTFGPGYSGSSSDYTMYNGTVRANGSFRFGKNIRYKLSHLASTYDVKNKIGRFYVDGEIMLEIRNYVQTHYRFGVQQNNTGKSFTVSGVAFFSSDKSINDGLNYKIPEGRYS